MQHRTARWSSRHGHRALNAETEVRTLDGQRAPVVQRTRHRRPKPETQVRLLPGYLPEWCFSSALFRRRGRHRRRTPLGDAQVTAAAWPAGGRASSDGPAGSRPRRCPDRVHRAAPCLRRCGDAATTRLYIPPGVLWAATGRQVKEIHGCVVVSHVRDAGKSPTSGAVSTWSRFSPVCRPRGGVRVRRIRVRRPAGCAGCSVAADRLGRDGRSGEATGPANPPGVC